MSIVSTDKLSISYGSNKVIEDFTFEVNEGEMVAVSGPSGKGKSSLLYTIGMLHNEYKGQFKLFDEINPNMNSKVGKELLKNRISFIFQNYALVDNKTVRYNLELAKKVVKSDISVEEALKFVGLSNKADSKIIELSGGEQQRIAIARAFIKKSELILADEPTGSLDVPNRDNVVKLFKVLQEKSGTTIIMVTHDEAIKKICDRVVEL